MDNANQDSHLPSKEWFVLKFAHLEEKIDTYKGIDRKVDIALTISIIALLVAMGWKALELLHVVPT